MLDDKNISIFMASFLLISRFADEPSYYEITDNAVYVELICREILVC